MAIDKCMMCETTIKGGAKVCPKCGSPVKAIKHIHEWKPVKGGSKAPSGKPQKYVCHKCGRVGMKTSIRTKSKSK